MSLLGCRRSPRIVFLLRLLLLLLVALAFSSFSLAQNSRGSVRGTVFDASGARVRTAQISLTMPSTSQTRRVALNERGDFRVDDLTPGNYIVLAQAKGFGDVSLSFPVLVNFVQQLSIVLKPQPVEESVNVAGVPVSVTSQPIDTATAIHQSVVTNYDLQSLPLAHRSFANIAYLTPGTEPVEPSDPTKARITAVSFGGSSGLNVQNTVDGGDNTDDYIGGFLQNFSADAIQEFAVQTAQEEAETGQTVGGSVVISTKHGSNDWHGGAAFYERASALSARYPLDNPSPESKQPFSRQNYVGTAGGPLKRERAWFFSSFEYVHEDASISYSPSSLSEFNALASLAADGLIPGVQSISVPNNVPVPFRDFLGTVRLDLAQSPHSQWFLRGALDNYTTENDLVQQATLASTGATSGSKYFNVALNNVYSFSPTWQGSFTADFGALHHTEARNQDYGFALAFPFSASFRTISGFETFGDNQFATPITAFPVLRDQQKYQLRYDVSHSTGNHSPKFGINFFHEPVLNGALSGTAETLISYANDPSFYAANPSAFYFSSGCLLPVPVDTSCSFTPAGNGNFSQNIQRLGLYAQDSWRMTSRLTVTYGLRWDTTFGLFEASGRSQLQNPAYLTLKALQIPLVNSAPHDYRAAFGPRLGLAYSLGQSGNTVIRAGVGLYYNDLAQNGWVNALQAVNAPPGPCVNPGNSGCLPGASFGGAGAVIDPNYKTPYALHATAGVEHAFNEKWILGGEYTHEQGNHAYRGYSYTPGTTLFSPLFPQDFTSQQDNVPSVTLFKTDNRSTYDAFTVKLQANLARRFNLVAHYTLARANTWGCVVGELFDYVNGVCNPLNPFGPGDYGPSGEDVRNRFVLAGTVHAPLGFELTTLTQAESARPYTLGTGVDVNGLGDPGNDRAVINGQQTSLDQFRGTPYIQVDLRVARPFTLKDRYTVLPFVEFFNLLNRNNPGNNFVADVGALNVPPSEVDAGNVTHLCADSSCNTLIPITRANQLRQPAGALGDFFGPGTTVGIPFAAQLGVRFSF